MDSDRRDSQTYEIIGAAMDVHREMGCGFHERAYRDPFMIELSTRKIPFVREKRFPIIYKNQIMPVSYRVDFICYGEVLVEIKALQAIGPIEHAQVINYLRAANLERALLLNFGTRSLQYKRVVFGWRDETRR